MNMEALNERILFVSELHKNGQIILECTFDRLILISRLENSVFSCPRVHPGVKYHFVSGIENECIEELEKLERNILAEFSDVSSMCTIVLERSDKPWPILSDLLQYLRSKPSFWRFVVFSIERTTETLVHSAQFSSPFLLFIFCIYFLEIATQ